MKKFTLFALAAMMGAPTLTFADSWEKVVTNGNEFKTAINSIGAGAEGETYTIICDWDANSVQNVSRIDSKQKDGTTIIKSNQTDFDKMPSLQIMVRMTVGAESKEVGKRLSYKFENMHLIGNNSYLMEYRNAIYADTIAIYNCDLEQIKRSILRFEGGGTVAENSLDVLDIVGNKFHSIDISAGDNWQPFRLFVPTNYINIADNMFYDMPYAKTLMEMRNPNETPSTFNFSNNMVLLAQNKNLATTGFQMLQLGSNIANGSQIYMYNNIISAPWKGALTLINDTTTYEASATTITNAAGVVMMLENNIIDSKSYQALADFASAMDAAKPSTTVVLGEQNQDFPQDANAWDEGVIFQDAEKSVYNMLKSNAWYTAGYQDAVLGFGATYIGPSIAYIDKFPVKASVKVSLDAPEYVSYTVTPEKAQYYVGDEVTISVNDHNSYYRTFNTFGGWSDGVAEKSRSVKIEGDIDLSAKITPTAQVLSAFDFSGITKNGSISEYDADICLSDAYKAKLTAVVTDTTGYGAAPETHPLLQVAGNTQTRPAKFGEDDVEMQMPIVSRRTPAVAKEKQRDYVVVEFSTKDLKGINFSCFVGTDNNAAKIQALDYSLDKESWTRLASVEIENGKWSELAADLPAELENKETVYVRVIGDLSEGHIISLVEAGGLVGADGKEDPEKYAAVDAFEYIGNILISYKENATGINGVAEKQQTAAPVVKRIKAGQVVIVKDGKTFTAAGAQTK